MPKLLFIGLSALLLLSIVFLLFSCGKSIPSESKRFANDAPIEEFDIPKETLTLPNDTREETKDAIRKTDILPFSFFDQHHFFYTAQDEQYIYVTMDYQADLEKSDPAEAQKRKPYRGVSAFDIKTKQLKWNIPFTDAASCTFPIDTNTMRISEPMLLNDHLIVFKKTYNTNLDNCYNIIDKNTGKVLYMEGMEGGRFEIEYLKYLVRYDYKKSISLLNPENGKVLWTYSLQKDFQGDGTNRIKLLNNQICYYDYQKPNHLGFDFIDISTGKVLKHLEFERANFNQTNLKPLAVQGDIVFFEVEYCSTMGFDIHHKDECEHCFVMFDTQTNRILKRTNYKK
ncbi:MAG: hypothetical protein JNM36_16665 [Chitinophagales bacterium]|nr:hypothetical protein [Chitinophagales bacterium]